MNREIDTKILVCCHKPSVTPESALYYPIHVGRARAGKSIGLPGDDTGDNISDKNESYCELTGMYWAWKNLKDVSIVGLCHYRRYFDFHRQCKWPFHGVIFPSTDFNTIDFSIPDRIIKAVESGSVVMAKPLYYHSNIYEDYAICHHSDDFHILEEVFMESQPEAYIKAFKRVMFFGNKQCPYNMFIMNRGNFNSYSSWLFELLEKVEKRIDISHFNPHQKRIFGFMAERLLNVYVEAEGLKIIHKPIIAIDSQREKKSHIANRSIYCISFGLRWMFERYLKLKLLLFNTH